MLLRFGTVPHRILERDGCTYPAAKAVVDLGVEWDFSSSLSKYRKFGQIIGADITAYLNGKIQE